jgi:hypothetical protein
MSWAHVLHQEASEGSRKSGIHPEGKCQHCSRHEDSPMTNDLRVKEAQMIHPAVGAYCECGAVVPIFVLFLVGDGGDTVALDSGDAGGFGDFAAAIG